MDNTLQVINRQNVLNKDFTVYGSIENPLFLAKDVAEWIEYDTNKIGQMLNGVDDDEKLTTTIKWAGQNREMWFLTENGLYEVLMLSRKPIAKQFKKEVKKILHQIRTTGGYTVPRTFADALRLAAEQQERIAIMQPKAEFYDDVTGSKDAIEMKEVAKVLNLGMGRNKIFEFLRDKKILDNNNQPYQIYVDKGYFRVIESKFTTPDGDVKINLKTVVMQKGLDFIRRQIKGLNESEIKTYRNKLANPTYMNNAINSIADRMVD